MKCMWAEPAEPHLTCSRISAGGALKLLVCRPGDPAAATAPAAAAAAAAAPAAGAVAADFLTPLQQKLQLFSQDEVYVG